MYIAAQETEYLLHGKQYVNKSTLNTLLTSQYSVRTSQFTICK